MTPSKKIKHLFLFFVLFLGCSSIQPTITSTEINEILKTDKTISEPVRKVLIQAQKELERKEDNEEWSKLGKRFFAFGCFSFLFLLIFLVYRILH